RGRAGAGLLRVADARRRATQGSAGEEGVGRTCIRGAVAELGDVARSRRRTADAAALHVRGTEGARAAAHLRRVAATRRRTAHGSRRDEVIRRAVVADA